MRVSGETRGLGHTQLMPLSTGWCWELTPSSASILSSLKWKSIVEPNSQVYGEDYLQSIQWTAVALIFEHHWSNRIFIETEKNLLLGMCAKSLKLLLTLCDPVDCSPPGSSVHGILQAGITYCSIFLYAHQQIAFPDGPIISMMTILPHSQYLQISINILKFLPCVFLSLSLFDYLQGWTF